jgi:hypothetical protein
VVWVPTVESMLEDAFLMNALEGTHGYSPNKANYEIVSMPGKVFSGYRILAYYYVSWSLATPEMLPQLQLPFDKEYTFAKEFVGERKTR